MILEPYMSRNKRLVLGGTALLLLIAGLIMRVAR
jgi:hypothetical protein